MRFVKASIKLPPHDKDVHIEVYGKIGYGRYLENRTPKIFWYQTYAEIATLTEDLFDRIQWLDKDEQDEGWVPVGEGLKLVATERKRQIEVEGWNNTHDADHDKMQLTGAAACYAANAINKKCGGPISRFQYNFPPEMNFLVNNGDRGDRKLDKGGWRDGWPWEAQWDKRDKHDVLRSLVISAALIVAEIDNILTPPATT